MPKNESSSAAPADLANLVKAGGISGLVNFFIKCGFDLRLTYVMSKSLNHETTHHSWQTLKGAVYWNFHYRMMMGFITFPLQRTLEQKLIDEGGGAQTLTLRQKAVIGSFAGWTAAMFEVCYAHPLESMCVAVQKKPQLFNT